MESRRLVSLAGYILNVEDIVSLEAPRVLERTEDIGLGQSRVTRYPAIRVIHKSNVSQLREYHYEGSCLREEDRMGALTSEYKAAVSVMEMLYPVHQFREDMLRLDCITQMWPKPLEDKYKIEICGHVYHWVGDHEDLARAREELLEAWDTFMKQQEMINSDDLDSMV